MKGLFIFRRDLRVIDNTGLYNLLHKCESVSCIFILDPEQIDPANNKYFSMNAVLFMIDCLEDLSKKIELSVLQNGNVVDTVEKLLIKHKFDIVGFNEDYTPYSRKRDAAIFAMVRKHGKEIVSYPDVCINKPDSIKPYKVFTPYYEVAKGIKVAKPTKMKLDKITKLNDEKPANLVKLRKKITKLCVDSGVDVDLIQRGGRAAAISCIKKFDSSNYKKARDLLLGETSRIGPHLKFGTISPREVYYAHSNGVFRKQLYWRDFYMQVAWYFPNVFGNNFKNVVKWEYNATFFKKWCAGETGYDIVDACMKHMNKAGFMPNRGRMIVASFLTKILHIDWRLGEKYFASRLTDYDPANNNGGWQWSAGTGVDAQPYFRIFSPFAQADKADPDGEYVAKWLGREKDSVEHIVDYTKERVRAMKLQILKKS